MDLTALFPGLDTLQLLVNLTGLLDVVTNATSYIVGNAILKISPIVNTCLTLYVVLYGWAMMSGGVKESLHHASIRIFKMVLVITLALNSGEYNTWLVTHLLALPKDLIDLLVPDGILVLLPSVPNDTDSALFMVTTIMSATVGMMQSSLQGADAAGGSNMTTFAIGMGTGMAGAGLTAVTAGILLVAKFTLSVLVGLSPIFIVSILFEKTKHFFEGWLAQVLNISLTLLLLTLTIYILFPVLLIAVSSYYLVSLTTGLTLTDSVELMTLLGIYISIIKQVPTTSAAIVRGYAIGSAGDWSLSGNQKSQQAQGSNQQAEYNNMQRR